MERLRDCRKFELSSNFFKTDIALHYSMSPVRSCLKGFLPELAWIPQIYTSCPAFLVIENSLMAVSLVVAVVVVVVVVGLINITFCDALIFIFRILVNNWV